MIQYLNGIFMTFKSTQVLAVTSGITGLNQQLDLISTSKNQIDVGLLLVVPV